MATGSKVQMGLASYLPVDREHLKAVDIQHPNNSVLAVTPRVPVPGFHDAIDFVHNPLKQSLVHRLEQSMYFCATSPWFLSHLHGFSLQLL